ncbi:MAG: adenine phosphoribosyltransferase [Deltaproteobacteria bacterium]|nr:MAG: adenine phosphoribosyltransferase [Deltaproteobacteria bacterium]
MGDLADDVRNTIRDVPDFPKPGILFKDITPVLMDTALFGRVIDWMAVEYANIDKIIAIESRGFIFGAPMVEPTGAGLVLARKPGKLPHTVETVSYDLEYGSSSLNIHTDAISPGDRCVIVDDLLATGGTACAALDLVQRLGGEVVGALFLVELGFLDGRRKLHGTPVTSLVRY